MSREYYYYYALHKDDGYYPVLFTEKGEPAECYWNYDHFNDEDSEIVTRSRISPDEVNYSAINGRASCFDAVACS